jgi:hypothetical protein
MVRGPPTVAYPAKWGSIEEEDDEFKAPIEMFKTRRKISSKKWTVSLVKQGKFKVGVVSADRLGHLLLKLKKY